jgi:hypothetical protein
MQCLDIAEVSMSEITAGALGYLRQGVIVKERKKKLTSKLRASASRYSSRD